MTHVLLGNLFSIFSLILFILTAYIANAIPNGPAAMGLMAHIILIAVAFWSTLGLCLINFLSFVKHKHTGILPFPHKKFQKLSIFLFIVSCIFFCLGILDIKIIRGVVYFFLALGLPILLLYVAIRYHMFLVEHRKALSNLKSSLIYNVLTWLLFVMPLFLISALVVCFLGFYTLTILTNGAVSI